MVYCLVAEQKEHFLWDWIGFEKTKKDFVTGRWREDVLRNMVEMEAYWYNGLDQSVISFFAACKENIVGLPAAI